MGRQGLKRKTVIEIQTGEQIVKKQNKKLIPNKKRKNVVIEQSNEEETKIAEKNGKLYVDTESVEVSVIK
jgi:hypothetical protein